jgi:ABC-type lipopolysaccharide export system ATPase subunit
VTGELVIETDALTKRYGDSVLAVDNLTLRVRRGEVYGFLGPNGAGKTTTLRMLLGLVRPSSGWPGADWVPGRGARFLPVPLRARQPARSGPSRGRARRPRRRRSGRGRTDGPRG